MCKVMLSTLPVIGAVIEVLCETCISSYNSNLYHMVLVDKIYYYFIYKYHIVEVYMIRTQLLYVFSKHFRVAFLLPSFCCSTIYQQHVALPELRLRRCMYLSHAACHSPILLRKHHRWHSDSCRHRYAHPLPNGLRWYILRYTQHNTKQYTVTRTVS